MGSMPPRPARNGNRRPPPELNLRGALTRLAGIKPQKTPESPCEVATGKTRGGSSIERAGTGINDHEVSAASRAGHGALGPVDMPVPQRRRRGAQAVRWLHRGSLSRVRAAGEALGTTEGVKNPDPPALYPVARRGSAYDVDGPRGSWARTRVSSCARKAIRSRAFAARESGSRISRS